MRWRHELTRSLAEEMDALDHRRDTFIQTLLHASTRVSYPSAECSGQRQKLQGDVEHFDKWLFEERRRLVRVTEMRCEESWRRAVMARDDEGRTPVHWVCSGARSNACLILKLWSGCVRGL